MQIYNEFRENCYSRPDILILLLPRSVPNTDSVFLLEREAIIYIYNLIRLHHLPGYVYFHGMIFKHRRFVCVGKGFVDEYMADGCFPHRPVTDYNHLQLLLGHGSAGQCWAVLGCILCLTMSHFCYQHELSNDVKFVSINQGIDRLAPSQSIVYVSTST